MPPQTSKEILRTRLFADEADFWAVFHPMNDMAEKMRGDSGAFVRGAMWAIGWTANTQGYHQFSALRKLWEEYFD